MSTSRHWSKNNKIRYQDSLNTFNTGYPVEEIIQAFFLASIFARPFFSFSSFHFSFIYLPSSIFIFSSLINLCFLFFFLLSPFNSISSHFFHFLYFKFFNFKRSMCMCFVSFALALIIRKPDYSNNKISFLQPFSFPSSFA